MRNAFIEELVELAEQQDNIALIVGDLGYSVVERFAERFPGRFINAGIAEQNMAGMAAGMASEGYHVFTYSIANFPTFRCAEQIRNDVDYHKLPVTVVVVGGGLSYGALGYSHHAVQDYALMRSMPNMLLAAPGDPVEVRACLRYIVGNPQPSYLRLGKNGESQVRSRTPEIRPGKWIAVDVPSGVIETPKRSAVLTTGGTMGRALALVSTPAFSDCALFSMPLWSQSSKEIQIEEAACFDEVITIEDHLIDGGFGSWLMESLAPAGRSAIVDPKGLSPGVCGTVGSQEALNAFGGLANIQRRSAVACCRDDVG